MIKDMSVRILKGPQGNVEAHLDDRFTQCS